MTDQSTTDRSTMSPVSDPMANALVNGASPQRLRAAMEIGTTADPSRLGALIERCRVEPDFFVRDMLTWALTRLPSEKVVPALLNELEFGNVQATGQALHTLSKIGDARGWNAVDPSGGGVSLLTHPDAEVARAAWRTAVVLVPREKRFELASVLVSQLGRGDEELQKSLSRAIVGLGEDLVSVLDGSLTAEEERVRTHALATREMFDDPDVGFAHAMGEARRVVALGSEVAVEVDFGKGQP